MEEGESLSDVASPHLQRLLQFARTVPGKMALLHICVPLRMNCINFGDPLTFYHPPQSEF